MKDKALTLGLVLAGTALGSDALTLGKARGAAWIGQPLELVAPVQLDPGQTDVGLCAEADVFYGDSRQEASRVQVQSTPSEQADTINLKITSSAAIDEPIVSVYLRAGCAQKSTRKFVLLADFPNEVVPSRVSAPTAPSIVSVTPPMTPSSAPAALSAPVTKALASRSRPAKPARSPKQPVIRVTKQTATQAEGKPRLRLDPIEEFGERIRALEAASAKANVQENIARDSQKLQALESDSRSLLNQAAKNEAALADIRARLEKTQGDRVPVAVLYGLAALVVLALGAMAFLWTQRTKHMAWKGAGLHTSAGPAKETGLDLDLS